MVTLDESTPVLYTAASGVCAPLCRLYFCKHCLKLRSAECVSHEIDSYYCPNCLETMPSGEARLKRNRCQNCFDCPSCQHTLSTRASTLLVPSPDEPDKTTPRKVYYLVCGFCRWSTRDVGYPDQAQSSGGWREKLNPNTQRVTQLLEYFQQMALKEKLEKDRRKNTRRRISGLHFSDKYGSASSSRRRSVLGGAGRGDEGAPLKPLDPAVAREVEEDLPDDFFTKPVSLSDVTDIQQRLAAPDSQPEMKDDLFPLKKYMLARRSERCRECEHNVSKLDFNPSSVKFKIQLVALHYVPHLKMVARPVGGGQISPGQTTKVILTLTNPAEYPVKCLLLPGNPKDDWTTADLDLPQQELLLSKRDDAAQYDDSAEPPPPVQDDPAVIAYRKANKIGVYVGVRPRLDKGVVRAAVRLQYDYKQTTPLGAGQQGAEPTSLEHPILITFAEL